MSNKNITICACVSRSFIDKDKVATIATLLQKEGKEVAIEADLCKKAIQDPERMKEIADEVILACYPRTIQSLFDSIGVQVTNSIDIRNQGYKEVAYQLQLSGQEREKGANSSHFQQIIQNFPVENGTDAWYPVIDKSRCTECGKCHDFCLFGVYTIKDKQVKVVQPQNCKNNCPACARMCPNKAIIFPKYEKSPINGGLTEEETFNLEEMNTLYKERLRMRLQQRRESVSLLKKDNK